MKKILILLLITLSQTTISFSQTTSRITSQDTIVSITSKQLKEANIIFLEHSRLLKDNLLLTEQVNNYKEDNNLLLRSDSIKSIQLDTYKSLTSFYEDKIKDLNKDIKSKNTSLVVWKIGGITVCAGLIVWLLLK
jgi:hypothetical protein